MTIKQIFFSFQTHVSFIEKSKQSLHCLHRRLSWRKKASIYEAEWALSGPFMSTGYSSVDAFRGCNFCYVWRWEAFWITSFSCTQKSQQWRRCAHTRLHTHTCWEGNPSAVWLYTSPQWLSFCMPVALCVNHKIMCTTGSHMLLLFTIVTSSTTVFQIHIHIGCCSFNTKLFLIWLLSKPKFWYRKYAIKLWYCQRF